MRIEAAGAFHHVTLRGNARATIFHDERDYHVFLKRLGETVERFLWQLHAFCVMPNHFHLLVETPEPNLGKGMLVLNGSYARRYNARYDRVGHVFQTPYRSTLVVGDPHFLEASRYIVLNPVRAMLTRDPIEWPYSSYGATAAIVPAPAWLVVDFTRAAFGGAGSYASFVAAPAMSGNQVAGHG
ncbi:MAG: transposase [Actinomycetota bacterium]